MRAQREPGGARNGLGAQKRRLVIVAQQNVADEQALRPLHPLHPLRVSERVVSGERTPAKRVARGEKHETQQRCRRAELGRQRCNGPIARGSHGRSHNRNERRPRDQSRARGARGGGAAAGAARACFVVSCMMWRLWLRCKGKKTDPRSKPSRGASSRSARPLAQPTPSCGLQLFPLNRSRK